MTNRPEVKGLEKEKKETQLKYQKLFGEQLDAGEQITFTGMYKYVDSGLTDKFGLPIYKRKRIFRKDVRSIKTITQEQRDEILQAFMLFDKDNSESIDTDELKDAMKALGIFMTKTQVNDIMRRIDKDGSGQVEKDEFVALMSELLLKRNLTIEMRKVFRFYDNDDDGSISYENIYQAADLLDMEDELNEQNVNMMIEMADKSNKGYITESEFLNLMKEMGVIHEVPQEQEEKLNAMNDEAFEQAKIMLEMERERAVEKAELMRRKAAMGNTPAFNII